jgi:chromosome segregation ATPase
LIEGVPLGSIPQSTEASASPIAKGAPHLRTKKDTSQRFRELLDERNDWRRRAQAAESAIATESETLRTLRTNLEAKDRELEQFRAEQKEREKNTLELTSRAREHGRKMFADFDAVIANVNLDRQAFQALVTSTNGPYLCYATGLGIKALKFQSQVQADRERVEYYRQLHQQHFAGAEK